MFCKDCLHLVSERPYGFIVGGNLLKSLLWREYLPRIPSFVLSISKTPSAWACFFGYSHCGYP